jgi:hypothetical protein
LFTPEVSKFTHRKGIQVGSQSPRRSMTPASSAAPAPPRLGQRHRHLLDRRRQPRGAPARARSRENCELAEARAFLEVDAIEAADAIIDATAGPQVAPVAPLALTQAQLDQVMATAQPIPPGMREEYLVLVAPQS